MVGVLAQGLVSRTGSGGGRIGELAAVALTLGGSEAGKAGGVPFTRTSESVCEKRHSV